ncbi:MAG: hypothetical protein K8953_04335, partial [Proteobacteria bacterium]|nr:hypothetical protein [Pseudomonadota bacterium]
MAQKPTKEQIKEAIIALDVNTDANWKKDGMPKIPVLQQALGVAVGSLQMGDVLEAMDIDPQAPVDMRSWRKDGWVGATTYENDPANSQDDAPADTPAENGNGESPAETPPTKPAEKTAG